MKRANLALALVGAVAVTGCMSGSKTPAGTDSDGQHGVTGVNYIIKVVAPAGGAVTSVPAGINCSTAVGAVCSATFAWTQQVVLSAVATAPNVLVAWAGDCEGSTLTCTLNGGADKTIVAVYGAPGSGHPNYTAAGGPRPGVQRLDRESRRARSSSATLATARRWPAMASRRVAAPASRGSDPGTAPVQFKAARGPASSRAVGTVNGAVVTFTLKDSVGADVYVTGAAGKNLPMPVTMGIVNFATDTKGNALPYKSATGGNPGTVSPYAALTSMSVTSGTWPSATAQVSLSGSLTKGGVACTSLLPAPARRSRHLHLYRARSASASVRARRRGSGLDAAGTSTFGRLQRCTSLHLLHRQPVRPGLLPANGPGMLTFSAGVYTYTFATIPTRAPALGLTDNTWTVWLATYRRENLANYLDGQAYTAANVEFNFSANTGLALASATS